MKQTILIITLVLALVGVCVAQDPGWPRQKKSTAGTLIYYPPQVDDWTNYKELDFRMAFSLTPAGGKQTVGVVNIHGQTDVSVDDRTVLLHDPVITRTDFPSLDASTSAQMDKLVRTFLPSSSSVVISLDRLIAATTKTQSPPTVSVRNEPPAIFVSNQPAILLQFDGEPVLADIKDTKLQFAVNTNWPVFLDKSISTYYLFTGKRWLTAPSLSSPWSITAALPKDMIKVAKDPQWKGLAGAISPVANETVFAPIVFYSTAPAEIILFKGKPVYSRIPGTQLVYATNTDADLFVNSLTQQYFYLAAGRWFSSKNLQGPWTYATENLPVDFAKIPPSSSAARVLVSVPGTEQAKDAVLLAQVPTTVEVDPTKAAAQVNVVYNGTPEFKPIEGTSLTYATNTADKVIRVDNAYYLCLQGMWFTSPNPTGPWTTATSIPAAIYTIPPSSPLYNVTYVTQTTTPTGVVHASYTAGYYGSFVVGTVAGVIITVGTGYYYPPYFYYGIGYPIYRPYAATYGYGAYYNSYWGAYGVARGVYGPYASAHGWASYNPYTGTYARGGSVYGPYGSASVGHAYNPYTGTYARGGSVSTSRGTVAGVRTNTGAAAIGASGVRGSGGVARSSSGDLYAAKDGNVYKKTGSGWQSYNNGSWNSTNKPTPHSASATRQPQMQSLNQDWQNRQRGAVQSRSYQNYPRSGGGYRGGGFRGGRRR